MASWLVWLLGLFCIKFSGLPICETPTAHLFKWPTMYWWIDLSFPPPDPQKDDKRYDKMNVNDEATSFRHHLHFFLSIDLNALLLSAFCLFAGCNDQRSTIKRAQICVENGIIYIYIFSNYVKLWQKFKQILQHLLVVLCTPVILGSLWTPNVKTTTFVENKKLCVFVRFQTAPYSDVYRVAIRTHGRQHSRNISRV